MTVGTTSRVHGFISLPTVPLPKQTHQETTTSIILSNRKRMEEWNRKHENILKIYFMCPCSSIFDLIQVGISNCPTLGGSITMTPSTPGSESRWLCWVAFRNLCALVHVDMPGEHDLRDFKFVSLVGFFCIGQFIQRCRLQVLMLLCHKLWTGGKGSLQL